MWAHAVDAAAHLQNWAAKRWPQHLADADHAPYARMLIAAAIMQHAPLRNSRVDTIPLHELVFTFAVPDAALDVSVYENPYPNVAGYVRPEIIKPRRPATCGRTPPSPSVSPAANWPPGQTSATSSATKIDEALLAGHPDRLTTLLRDAVAVLDEIASPTSPNPSETRGCQNRHRRRGTGWFTGRLNQGHTSNDVRGLSGHASVVSVEVYDRQRQSRNLPTSSTVALGLEDAVAAAVPR